MAFQTAITIKAALDAIQAQDYVLPAIQRAFTWRPQQVCRLFDSLMQGYPIGSFLFWKIEADHSHDYTWYGFLRDYHQRHESGRRSPVLALPKKPLTAILDGQQRLTSLNIGLLGSHSEKEPRKRYNRESSYPKKYLYVNLCALAPENEAGLKYDFRFLTPERAAKERDEAHYWYKVSDVYAFESSFQVLETLQGFGIANNKLAGRLLHDLYMVVHEKGLIPYYEETAQDAEKVLNIFIRVNSAGTPLSYSDMLLSIATARWDDLEAREVIPNLVDELIATRQGFQLTKDLVLKAGLALSDIPSVAFRVTNFNTKNMSTLQEKWGDIERALRLAVELLADFGFSHQTLAADSVLIPVAYYLDKRGLDEGYLTAVAQQDDRERIRGWVCRSLIKSGVWGSGLDTLLLALRDVLRAKPLVGFPVAELEAAMGLKGMYLRFSEEEIQNLLDSAYGDKRTFALLALMFPHLDVRNLFHLDHVFPRSLFTNARLRDAGVPEEKREGYLDMVDRLPNLQLLEGAENVAKRAKLPSLWLAEKYQDGAIRSNYCALHDLGTIPESLADFDQFYAARRERLAARLRRLLVVTAESVENGVED